MLERILVFIDYELIILLWSSRIKLETLRKKAIWGFYSFGIVRPSTFNIWMMPTNRPVAFCAGVAFLRPLPRKQEMHIYSWIAKRKIGNNKRKWHFTTPLALNFQYLEVSNLNTLTILRWCCLFAAYTAQRRNVS